MTNNFYSDVLCCYMRMSIFDMVFPIEFKSCWQCFKHGYYCPIHSFTQTISYRVVRGCLGWFNTGNFRYTFKYLLSNSFPWSCRICFGNPKSRKYLLNIKSAAAPPELFWVRNAFTNLLTWSTTNKIFITP